MHRTLCLILQYAKSPSRISQTYLTDVSARVHPMNFLEDQLRSVWAPGHYIHQLRLLLIPSVIFGIVSFRSHISEQPWHSHSRGATAPVLPRSFTCLSHLAMFPSARYALRTSTSYWFDTPAAKPITLGRITTWTFDDHLGTRKAQSCVAHLA